MFNLLSRMNMVFAVLFGMIVWPFVLGVGPIAEQKIWPGPVVTRSIVTRIDKPINPLDEWMKFYGEAYKVRNCNYDHLEWYSGDPDGAYSRLTMEIEQKVTNNPNMAGDKVEYGPIKVFINETHLRTNTFAIVYHRCHAFWLSQSIFYP